MPISRCLFVVALTLLAIAAKLSANIYIPHGAGATLAPLKSEDIVMESERVRVEQAADFDDDHRTEAVYVMRNDSDRTVTTRVAFPFRERNHTALRTGNFRVTVVDAQGRETSPECEKIRPDEIDKSPFDFGAAYAWDVTWAPRETKTINVNYAIGSMLLHDPFVSGWRLAYVVNTGAFWKGPIGSAEFTFRFRAPSASYPPSLDDAFLERPGPDVAYPGYSYPDHARRISPTEIQWRFEDWTPTEDVWVGYLRWKGMDGHLGLRNVVFTGPDYRGAELAYDDAFLEQWVSFRLDPHRVRFPQQTRAFRPRLKALYARALYHEILARNGEGFYLGRANDGQPDPPDAYAEDTEGNYISIWQNQFQMSSRYTNWYRPGTGKGPHGSVRLEDLTEIERRNLAFLQTYFDPAEAHPAKRAAGRSGAGAASASP
jgi:hypothetical protein